MDMEQAQPKTQMEIWQQNPAYPGMVAMATRQLHEQDRIRQMMDDGTGQMSQAARRSVQMDGVLASAIAGYYLEMIDGKTELDFGNMSEIVVNGMDGEAIRGALKDEQGTAPATGSDVDQARTFLKDIIKGYGDNLAPGSDERGPANAKYFRERYQAAQSIAEERGVSVATVFQSDELYEEFVKRSDTPEKLAEILLAGAQTDEKVMGFAVHMAKSVAVLEGDPLGPDEAEEFEEDLRKDPEFQQEISRIVRRLNRKIPGVIEQELARFWGEEAYGTLPADLKQRIEVLAGQAEQEEVEA